MRLVERQQALDIDPRAGCPAGDDVKQAFVLLQEFLVRNLREKRSLAPPMMKMAFGRPSTNRLHAVDHARYGNRRRCRD